MDLTKTGEFIAERRKAKNLTQAKLAEKIFVSEKTVSKWECGKGFPDTSIILLLCEVLEISANELLSGKLLSKEEYKINAEENLIALKNQQARYAKHLLTLEYVVGFMSSLIFLISIFFSVYVIEPLAWKIVLVTFGSLSFLIGLIFTLLIEREAGYYQCGNCGHKRVPSYKEVLFSMHIGRSRYLKCPKCGKRTWNKKKIDK